MIEESHKQGLVKILEKNNDFIKLGVKVDGIERTETYKVLKVFEFSSERK